MTVMIRLRQLLHMLRLYTGGALGVLNLCKQVMIMRKQFHNEVNLNLHVDKLNRQPHIALIIWRKTP